MQEQAAVDQVVDQAVQHAAAGGGAQITGWLTQPKATLISAGAVVLAALFTYWYTQRRHRGEQLERRAKEKENRLQSVYADFSTAAFQVLRYLTDIAATKYMIEIMDDEIAAQDDKTAEEATADLTKRKTEEWAEVHKYRTALASAYARLLLIEDDPERMAMATKLSAKVNSWRPHLVDHNEEDLLAELRSFAEEIGFRLDAEYQESRKQATKGRAPQPKPRVRHPSDAQKIT